jgi:hypothetical protein
MSAVESKGDQIRMKRALILQALTDPKFRQLLKTDPAKAIGKPTPSAVQFKEIDLILAAVSGIEAQIANMADQLLCNNGGCSVVV